MRVCPSVQNGIRIGSQSSRRQQNDHPAGMSVAREPSALESKIPSKNLAALVEFASILVLNHLSQTVINLVHSSQIKIACSSDAIAQSISGVDGSQRSEADVRPALMTAATQFTHAPQFNHIVCHLTKRVVKTPQSYSGCSIEVMEQPMPDLLHVGIGMTRHIWGQ